MLYCKKYEFKEKFKILEVEEIIEKLFESEEVKNSILYYTNFDLNVPYNLFCKKDINQGCLLMMGYLSNRINKIYFSLTAIVGDFVLLRILSGKFSIDLYDKCRSELEKDVTLHKPIIPEEFYEGWLSYFLKYLG
jgi:hypothetical protein